MIHWRDTIHHMASEGLIEPLVAFDLDLENMFGNIKSSMPKIPAKGAKGKGK